MVHCSYLLGFEKQEQVNPLCKVLQHVLTANSHKPLTAITAVFKSDQ